MCAADNRGGTERHKVDSGCLWGEWYPRLVIMKNNAKKVTSTVNAASHLYFPTQQNLFLVVRQAERVSALRLSKALGRVLMPHAAAR